jgi:hypothetical protein
VIAIPNVHLTEGRMSLLRRHMGQSKHDSRSDISYQFPCSCDPLEGILAASLVHTDWHI